MISTLGLQRKTNFRKFLSWFSALIWFRTQLFGSCCQPGGSWCDGPYHKDSRRGNNNSYLGIWPIPAWQPCVERLFGRSRSYPHSCNKGLLHPWSSPASVCLYITDPVIWTAYQSLWKPSAGMRHFRPAQNSSSQQCSVGHCPSHAICIIQTPPGRWSFMIFSLFFILSNISPSTYLLPALTTDMVLSRQSDATVESQNIYHGPHSRSPRLTGNGWKKHMRSWLYVDI